jgi:DNA-binding XRE family transcriptional regulator
MEMNNMTSQAVFKSPKESSEMHGNNYFGGGMISGAQIRAARALLRWSARELADRCGLSQQTIQVAERSNGMPENMLAGTLMKIKTALEKGGVEFDGNGGLKLRKRK